MVDRRVPGELEQAFAKLGQGRPATSALGLKLTQEVDHGMRSGGRVRPEAEGQLAAQEVEVQVDESLLALAGKVLRDAAGARKSRGHVLDDGAVLVVAQALFGLALLKGLGGGLGLLAGHKFASPPAV